ncbi:MAG: hypothetical protein ABEI57_03360 [Halapricum sp.]
MQRRSYLAALGGAFAVATAGCMSAADDPGNSPPADGSTTTTEPPDGSMATDEALAFADVGCPSFDEHADRTICSTTADEGVPVRFDPPQPAAFEPTTDDDTVETFPITLANHSETTFGFNPYAWALKRHTDEGWVHVAPDAVPEPWTTLEPGESYTFSLSAESIPTQRVDGSRSIVLDLDSGVYAMVIDGLLGEDESSERIECVALFAVRRADT